jgi:hypothetical protein
LSERARAYAKQRGVESYESLGESAVTLFPCGEAATSNGNFATMAIAAIQADDLWRRRLDKPHARKDALPAQQKETARELDSSMSSDALLMNCFCHPGAIDGQIARLLHVRPGTRPEFGVAGEVPLKDGTTDRTEIDMVIGDSHVEAKLTEADFTQKATSSVARYEGVDDVFHVETLISSDDELTGYQLVRNVLAIASHADKRFIVLLDARRPDLLREWWKVYGAIRDQSVRSRCGFVLWQEIAEVSQPELKSFLVQKYGL